MHRISNTAAAAYYIYGAPFEIVVASIFLYKWVTWLGAVAETSALMRCSILGWSAFAGMITLVIALPLNSFVSGRYIKVRTASVGSSDSPTDNT